MTFGIHQFKNSKNSASYFVERPFGNLLIFSDDLNDIDHEFIKSKGGLFRQYFESFEGITSLNKKLFKIYGAKGIGNWIDEKFDPEIALERFNIDFSDPSLNFYIQGASKYIVLKQGSKKVALLGSSFLLKANGDILCLGHDHTESMLNKLKNDSVDLLYFTSFESQSSLVFKKLTVIEKIKKITGQLLE